MASTSLGSRHGCRLLAGGLTLGALMVAAAGTSAADLVADKARTVDNDTGWHLSVTKTRETLDRYPNLAATMFTRVTISQFPAVTLGASASVSSNISTTVKPGGITTVEIRTKPLAGARASIAVDQVQIKVDACMGPVSLRSFATARISTPEADDTVSVYGDPIYL